jgi:hypothetical protein
LAKHYSLGVMVHPVPAKTVAVGQLNVAPIVFATVPLEFDKLPNVFGIN